MDARLRGTLLVLVSATSFGCVGLLGKVALGAGASVETILALRWALGALGVAAVLAALGRFALPRERLVPLALLGLAGLLATSFCFFVALRTLDAGVASVLLFTSPVLVALAARPLFGERLGRRGLAALALALAGVAFVAGARGRVDPAGAAWALAGAVAYAAYILGSRRFVAGVEPLGASVVIMLAGSLGFVALGLGRGALAVPAPTAAWAILGLGLVGGAVAIATFQMGLPHVGASRSAILSTVEPATTVLVGALVLAERMTGWQLAGAVAIGASAVLVASRA